MDRRTAVILSKESFQSIFSIEWSSHLENTSFSLLIYSFLNDPTYFTCSTSSSHKKDLCSFVWFPRHAWWYWFCPSLMEGIPVKVDHASDQIQVNVADDTQHSRDVKNNTAKGMLILRTDHFKVLFLILPSSWCSIFRNGAESHFLFFHKNYKLYSHPNFVMT